MKIYFQSKLTGSNGLRALSQATGIPRITGKHKFKKQNIYIRYGMDGMDKIKQLQEMQHRVRIPDYTLGHHYNLFRRGRFEGIWLARTLLNASEGRGIVVMRTSEDTVPALLYTKYIRKIKEYRVHLFKGKPVIITQKRREEGRDPNLIRSHSNGYVHCVHDVDCNTDELFNIAQAAWACTGHVDIAAVDIIIGKDDDLAYVLEVNTGPGLSSETVLEAYKGVILKWVEDTRAAPPAEAKTTDTSGKTDTPFVSVVDFGRPRQWRINIDRPPTRTIRHISSEMQQEIEALASTFQERMRTT